MRSNRLLLVLVFIGIATAIIFFWLSKNSANTPAQGAAAIAFAATLIKIIDTILKHKKESLPDISRRQLADQARFTDRRNELRTLLNIAKGAENKIVNIYGVKGVGKSTLLKMLADIINGRVKRQILENLQVSVSRSSLRARKCLYFDLSDRTGIDDIASTICERSFPNAGKSLESFELNLKQNAGKRPLVIILDNLNNQGIAKDLSQLITSHWTFRPQDIFILGSVPKLPIYLSGVSTIELMPLQEPDVADYAQHKGLTLTKEDLSEVFGQSRGLPLYLEIILHAKTDGIENKFINRGLRDLVINQILPRLGEQPRRLLRLIAHMSIVQTEVSKRDLADLGYGDLDNSLVELEESSLLIRQSGNFVKIHDILRDFLVEYRRETLAEISLELASYYRSISRDREATLYYLLGPELSDAGRFIYKTIEREFEAENIPFLISVGETFHNYHHRRGRGHIEMDLRRLIICAYLSGILKTGDYPRAHEVSRRIVIGEEGMPGMQNIQNEIDFRFHFILADLDHLLNRYSRSIEVFRQLRDIATDRGLLTLIPECIWGMAHCYRHQGKDLQKSLDLYKELESTSIECGNYKYRARALTGQVCIHLVWNDLSFPFEESLTEIYKTAGEYPEIIFSTKKYHAMYLRRINRLAESKSLIHEAMDGFESLGNRLTYNMKFELGEHFRALGDYDKAYEFYKISCNFSRKNRDRNMQTHSMIGIVLTEILSETYYMHSSLEEMLEEINEAMQIADEADLRITEIQAQLVGEYLKRAQGLAVEGFTEAFSGYIKKRQLKREAEICADMTRSRVGRMHLVLL